MIYEIQSVQNGRWTNDASLLGEGLDQSANRWDTKAEAIAAMDELIDIWPEERSRLRVVEIDPADWEAMGTNQSPYAFGMSLPRIR